MLLAFFVPSSVLSKLPKKRRRAANAGGKHGPRDAAQVLANGGIAAACAIASLDPKTRRTWAAAFAGACAAASADTWGTELGTRFGSAPRSILTGHAVEPGLSGGVTPAGTLAELAGAAAVAYAAARTSTAPFAAVWFGGVAGALVDSLLGARAQSLRRCLQCASLCESDPHACGGRTVLVRGHAWIGNDAVNAAATLTGAGVAALASTFFRDTG